VAYAAQQALPEDWEPYVGPVAVEGAYIYARPKNPSSEYKTSVPDLGNLDKAVEDALSGVVYLDDRYIIDHRYVKSWAEEDQDPGVYVKVIAL